MRLPALLILAGCTGGASVELVPSERGPSMVRVAGDTVRLGWKKTEAVEGFSMGGAGMPPPLPGPAGSLAPGQPGASGPQGPPNPNGPQGPPNPNGTAPPGSPTGAPSGAPTGTPTGPPSGAPTGPPPTGPVGPPNPQQTPGPPHPPTGGPTGSVLPAGLGGLLGVAHAASPTAGGAPDLGLAPGHASKGGRPMPDPLDPIDVEVSAFLIDVTEVTQAQYALFLEDTGYRPPYVDEGWAEEGWDWDGTKPPAATVDHPVVLVNWWDAKAYCAWAGKRLPTEAEWQLAAIGPADDERIFPWGDEYDGSKLNHGKLDEPNFDDSDGYERTSPVGAYPEGASRTGMLDAFGNAWEWTADIRVRSWDEVLGERRGERIVDPHTGETGLYAAVRGGAYFFDLRPNPGGERNGFLVELRRKTSGFRCARDP